MNLGKNIGRVHSAFKSNCDAPLCNKIDANPALRGNAAIGQEMNV